MSYDIWLEAPDTRTCFVEGCTEGIAFILSRIYAASGRGAPDPDTAVCRQHAADALDRFAEFGMTISIRAATGWVEVYEVGNHTSNTSRMWGHAGCWLGDLDGQRAGDWVDCLEAAVQNMRANPDTYRAMNPENGWGSYESALDYMQRVLDACRAYPDARVGVCR